MSAAERTAPADQMMLDEALGYAKRGWHIFPCKPANKAPYVGCDHDWRGEDIPNTGGLYKATTNAEQVRAWWLRWPAAMIGVRMGSASGVWAIDPDAPKEDGDADGRAAWAVLIAKHVPVHTHAHSTPGGGQHLLFKWDPARPVTNREGALKGSGINVRGEGGYIIAPPSRRADGKTYEIVEPLDYFNFADAPQWLYDLILANPEPKPSISARASTQIQRPASTRRRAYAEAALHGEHHLVAGTAQERNIALNKAAFNLGTFVGAGELSEGEVIGVLYDAATACGYVQSDGQRATMKTINSGLRAGMKHPREIPEGEEHHPAGQEYQRDSSKNGAGGHHPAAPVELLWHGDQRHTEPRAWLIDKLLPETGAGLASGQWGAAKTFAMMDLSASVMTGTPFAGREVTRRGGVLFVAAEGAGEIPSRLAGVVEHKLRPAALAAFATVHLDRLPFAWIEECPPLKDDDAFERLVATALQAAANIKEQFDLPLALIVVDTLNAAANFKDGNDAAEGQLVMNRLQELSRRTGALTLAVDHFGKAVETGTRGTSAKEAAADFVLALLAERDTAGTISNTRMAVRKLRAGATGSETPFNLKVVDIGDGETTCIIEWKAEHAPQGAQTARKERWTKSLRIFRSAMQAALIEHGKVVRPYGGDGAAVRAVPANVVRTEFMAAYPAGEDKGTDAKRQAFKRALQSARERDLICSREIDGVDLLWFVQTDDEQDNSTIHRSDGQDT